VITEGQRQALTIAKELAGLGMPMFLAYPDASKSSGYALPPAWQQTPADPQVVDNWRPGMALCAVTGHVLDLIDIDPRSGGDLDPVALSAPVLALAHTPSGGQHRFVPTIGVPSRDGVWPGVDIKSGAPDGSGRGFAFIAPTIRKSKVDGLPRPYVWSQDHRPDKHVIIERLEVIRQYGNTGLDHLRNRIAALRSERSPTGTVRRIPQSVAREEWQRAVDKLASDLRHWSAHGWGGEAHAGLLAASTHLARLSPESAAEAFEACFAWTGLTPDDNDMAKMDSALAAAVPDVVVPDADMPPEEVFWAGGIASVPDPPQGGDASGPPAAGPEYTRSGGFRFLTEHELDRIPVPDPLVDGLLWTDSLARVFGPSSVGKTWVGLDIAAHAANGMAWQGHEVKQVPVLYVAAEGAPTIGPRLRAWRSFHGRDSQIRTWPEAVPIGGYTWPEFITACVDSNVGLIVMDTQAAMTVGSKEDSNDDAARNKAHLETLARATRACVLLIHHNGWAEDGRARGASGMHAALDTELQLIEGQGERAVSLLQRKQRYAERGAPVRLRLLPHEGQLVVAPANVDGSSADAFLAADMDARARALFEKILAYEASGGALPPKLGVRQVKTMIRDEMFETVESVVAEHAVRLLKRAKGIAV
jgi:hypothetical protein